MNLLFEETNLEVEERENRFEEFMASYENIKSSAGMAETLQSKKLKRIGLIMQPIERLKQGDGSSRTIFIALGMALLGLAVVSFFLSREFSMHRKVTLQLGKSEQIRSEMEHSFAELKKEMAAQKQELTQMSEELDQTKSKAALVDQQKKNFEDQIANLKRMYENQINELRNQLNTKDKLTQSLRENLESIRGLQGPHSEELTPAGDVISQPGAASAQGKITLVDRQNHFVITDLGITKGVSMGQVIRISNGDKLIGEARIDRIYYDLSAATLLSDQALSEVQKGDSVTA